MEDDETDEDCNNNEELYFNQDLADEGEKKNKNVVKEVDSSGEQGREGQDGREFLAKESSKFLFSVAASLAGTI
jgi:hypothetical protein